MDVRVADISTGRHQRCTGTGSRSRLRPES